MKEENEIFLRIDLMKILSKYVHVHFGEISRIFLFSHLAAGGSTFSILCYDVNLVVTLLYFRLCLVKISSTCLIQPRLLDSLLEVVSKRVHIFLKTKNFF